MNDVDVAPPSPPAERAPETRAVLELCGNGHQYGRLSVNGVLLPHGCPICLREGLNAARTERDALRAADRTAEYAALLRRVVAWADAEDSDETMEPLLADIRATLAASPPQTGATP